MAPRRPTEKLLEVAKAGGSRRQQYSAATRRALVEVATEAFTEKGYAGASLDSIVAGARVTKGALYHHFAGKQAVFESVFEEVERRATKQVKRALKGHRDPYGRAVAGLHEFLLVVQDPHYARIVIEDGPAVLGYERYREQEERSTFGIVQDIVRGLLDDAQSGLGEEMLQTFSRLFFGALSAAGRSVTTAEDKVLAVARIETAIGFLMSGIRTLGEQGARIEDPATAGVALSPR